MADTSRFLLAAVLASAALLPAPSTAQDLKGSIDGSLRWLRRQQLEDGTWDPAVE